MVPIILLSEGALQTDEYIKKFAGKHSIPAYNVFIYEPEKKEFSIEQVRSVRDLIRTLPSSTRLIVLKSFDTASTEAQNALLKTLEEKASSNQFILEIQNTEKILPTIQSRSTVIRTGKKLDPILESNYENFFDTLAKSSTYSFLGNSLLQGLNRDNAMNMLNSSILYLRKFLKNSPEAPIVIKKALKTKKLLDSNNLNPQLATDAFLIFWKKTSLSQGRLDK